MVKEHCKFKSVVSICTHPGCLTGYLMCACASKWCVHALYGALSEVLLFTSHLQSLQDLHCTVYNVVKPLLVFSPDLEDEVHILYLCVCFL